MCFDGSNRFIRARRVVELMFSSWADPTLMNSLYISVAFVTNSVSVDILSSSLHLK